MVNGTAWAGAAETVKYGVHLGMWTNWSRGRIMGATLTLSRQDGNYLLAFTAFFIGLVSARFWRIVCFILHNLFSTSTPRDALYHQQQAILRNSASANSGLFVFCQLAWAWRKTAKRAFFRVLPVITTASFSAVAFTIAGGFSSSISTGIGNDVLLDGSNCAFVNLHSSDSEAQSLLQPYTSRQSNSAANYAQQCYSTNTSGIFNCGTFVKARVPSSVDNQTACPFAEGLCQSDANLRLDSGYIDSHEHLGLNAPPDERIFFRTVLQCAPIVTEGYTNNISTSSANYTSYNYGPRLSLSNYTYRISSWETQYLLSSGNEFKVVALKSSTLNGSTYPEYSDFAPTPGLFPVEGDLMLTFLSGNGVVFMERSDDPWYRGTVPGTNITNAAKTRSQLTYRPEKAASPMACLQQYQFCNAALPEESRCSPLTGLLDAQVQAAHLFNMTYDQFMNNDEPQTPVAARYRWFLKYLTLATPGLSHLINVLGPNMLASQQSLVRTSSTLGAISSNQWQLDVEYWWAIFMASLQSGMVDMAYGPHNAALDPYKILPYNSHVQNLCNNQKILSSDYTSFSVFGLCFIYVIGALIVAISYLLEPIQARLYRRRNLKEYAYLEWTANETLQLQRMAYQGFKSGQWSRYTDLIPLTEPGEILADLARSYPLRKKKDADVEQGNSGEKSTGAIVTSVRTAPPTQVETDSSTLTSCDDNLHENQASVGGRQSPEVVSPVHSSPDKGILSPPLSHVDQAGVGGRQSVEVVSPVHIPRDESGHSPALPQVVANPPSPVDAAPLKAEQSNPQSSKDPAIDMPESDGGPARDLSCSPVEGRSRT